MYDKIACEPQKEITLEQIIKDSHETLCEIGAGVGLIGQILFGIDQDEPKKDNIPTSCIGFALADDVNTEKIIAQKLNYIIERLR